jgi:hypothetical protein
MGAFTRSKGRGRVIWPVHLAFPFLYGLLRPHALSGRTHCLVHKAERPHQRGPAGSGPAGDRDEMQRERWELNVSALGILDCVKSEVVLLNQ